MITNRKNRGEKLMAEIERLKVQLAASENVNNRLCLWKGHLTDHLIIARHEGKLPAGEFPEDYDNSFMWALDQYRQIVVADTIAALPRSEGSATWHDRYMRDVEGLNNEGDPIGGDPPLGLRHLAERGAQASADLQRLTAMLPEHPEGWDGPCWCRVCASYAAEEVGLAATYVQP